MTSRTSLPADHSGKMTAIETEEMPCSLIFIIGGFYMSQLISFLAIPVGENARRFAISPPTIRAATRS